MADINFDDDGKVRFLTRHHGEVTLSKTKWDLICSKAERYYYRLNGEKIATTLIGPDLVRWHDVIGRQLFYYKRFPKWQLVAGVDGPSPAPIMAVVIDSETQRICTVFPVKQPKSGREYRA